jgi:hypothetical protein
MDDFKDLLDIAASESNLTDCPFDTFLKENGYSEDDLSKRILYNDLFVFYAKWYFNKYKKVPHRSSFTEGSGAAKLYRLRQRYPGTTKLAWGLKCSVAFKIAYLQFKKDAPEWQKKLTRILGAKKSHKARKINQREKEQLERMLSIQGSIPDSSQK